MDLQPGLALIDPSAVEEIAEAARQVGLRVYVIDTGDGVGREAFFDAVRASLPQDPPLLGSRSWDALSDSVWEGMRCLDVDRIAIVWPDATAFRQHAESDFAVAMSVLGDLADSLADVQVTNGAPKKVSVFVGIADRG